MVVEPSMEPKQPAAEGVARQVWSAFGFVENKIEKLIKYNGLLEELIIYEKSLLVWTCLHNREWE